MDRPWYGESDPAFPPRIERPSRSIARDDQTHNDSGRVASSRSQRSGASRSPRPRRKLRPPRHPACHARYLPTYRAYCFISPQRIVGRRACERGCCRGVPELRGHAQLKGRNYVVPGESRGETAIGAGAGSFGRAGIGVQRLVNLDLEQSLPEAAEFRKRGNRALAFCPAGRPSCSCSSP
jgi:hypothetical protein